MKLINGDCLEEMKKLEDNSVDSIVTDPPAGISFMGKEWDKDKGGRDSWIAWMCEVATECKRVLKPGGHAFVWAIPRTSHWTATAWENAGFEIRDVVAHVFGSGFPKSHSIGKAVDKLQGNEREVIGKRNLNQGISVRTPTTFNDDAWEGNETITKGTSEYEGWGSALKPAREDWLLMRKPLDKGLTIAENCLKWKTGGINIDISRIKTEDQENADASYRRLSSLYESLRKEPYFSLSYLDFSKRILSELGSYNKDGKDPSHNEVVQDDSQLEGVECVTLLKTLFPNGAWCGLTQNEVQGFQSDYPVYSHLYDEHIQTLIESAQVSPASLYDALLSIDYSQYAQEHNRKSQCNDHLSNLDVFRLSFCLLLIIKLYTTHYIKSTTGSQGRFPANICHDNSEEVRECFPESNSGKGKASTYEKHGGQWGKGNQIRNEDYGDSGNASRFFKSIIYQAKASKSERNKGCEGLEEKESEVDLPQGGIQEGNRRGHKTTNHHPTVKPIALMEYLIKMITPKGGTVLDPFSGSFSTGIACVKNGFGFIGIEREAEYVKIGKARIAHAEKEQKGKLFF